MERSDKKNELLRFVQKYRLVREEDIMFFICLSMEEVQSTSQIVELSGKIRVLLCELPLTVKERHRLNNLSEMNGDMAFLLLTFWIMLVMMI